MAVLTLMYHRTPKHAGHMLDVAMPLFRAQMQLLKGAGVTFIPFSEALDRRWYGKNTVVCVTFDDGHTSNLEAMAFLQQMQIPCTSFFISNYIQQGEDGFMDARAFVESASYCEVGAHGASHTSLTSLVPTDLDSELSESKQYLENLCGRAVTTMSAPGGKINASVVSAAIKAGYEVIGDSEAFLNIAPQLPVHRVCMLNGQSPEYLLRIIEAGYLYWTGRRIRRTVGRAMTWAGLRH